MRPDLPWNVAGIPPEAREAARAAARREGLSVGEWLTRRILRSFADAGDEDELNRDSWATNKMYRAEEQAPSSRRDTDEMLDRVSRSEVDSNDVYRRIEEQLRGVARRMDSAERSQSENNRTMTKAATEINIAAREQAQAFDQLGAHVVGLADRLDRVERNNGAGGLKDAVKGLHTGLSRLADQITQNANQSATQISALANNLESVAGRLGQARENAEGTARTLEQRIVALDDRVYAVEKASQAGAAALEQRIAAFDDRVYAVEKASQAGAAALDRALEGLRAGAGRDPEAEQREAATAGAIARLEENLGKLEARGPDPEIERRLGGIEQSLSEIASRLESGEPSSTRVLEDSVKKLLSRVEATENRQRDTVAEFRAALNETTERLTVIETKPPVAPTAAAFTPLPPAFDAPPFPDVPTPGAPPPFQAQSEPYLPPPSPAYESAPPFAAEPAFVPAQGFAAEAFAPPPTADSYLSAARRSARAAASHAEAELAPRGFNWGAAKQASAGPAPRSRTVLLAFITLIAVALAAGVVLSQSLLGQSTKSSGLGALFSDKSQTSAPAQAGTPLHALSPQAENGQPQAVPSAASPAAAGPNIETQPSTLPPLQQKTVSDAPIHTVPTPPSATRGPAPGQQIASIPALDRITALANGGNAKAELMVGLKYLNGDGVAVNEAQAAKWLERSAESGEAVAQYRLGTLYERGKGVAADPVKATHWYQAAAMQGNRKAMHNLAVAYAEGTGIKKDLSEAARWFSKAASLGLADSEFNLAVLYERGLGVPQSLLDAYKWYAIAAASGDGESKARIDALATQLSADDRAAAEHAADSFKPAPIDARANVPPQLGDLPPG